MSLWNLICAPFRAKYRVVTEGSYHLLLDRWGRVVWRRRRLSGVPDEHPFGDPLMGLEADWRQP